LITITSNALLLVAIKRHISFTHNACLLSGYMQSLPREKNFTVGAEEINARAHTDSTLAAFSAFFEI
jgi:hypothetical protein